MLSLWHVFATYWILHDVTILGHSLGAHVGLAYAAKHPQRVKNLVLISPIPRPNLMSRAVSLYYQIGRALPAPLEHGWLTNRKVHQTIRKFVVRTNDPVLREQIMREGERELKELRPNVNVENFLSLVSTDPEYYIPHLSVPTLVLAGDLDRLTRLSDVVNAYQHPLIELRVIKGMGHYGPSEIPGEISAIVMSWLQRDSALLASPNTELPLGGGNMKLFEPEAQNLTIFGSHTKYWVYNPTQNADYSYGSWLSRQPSWTSVHHCRPQRLPRDRARPARFW